MESRLRLVHAARVWAHQVRCWQLFNGDARMGRLDYWSDSVKKVVVLNHSPSASGAETKMGYAIICW